MTSTPDGSPKFSNTKIISEAFENINFPRIVYDNTIDAKAEDEAEVEVEAKFDVEIDVKAGEDDPKKSEKIKSIIIEESKVQQTTLDLQNLSECYLKVPEPIENQINVQALIIDRSNSVEKPTNIIKSRTEISEETRETKQKPFVGQVTEPVQKNASILANPDISSQGTNIINFKQELLQTNLIEVAKELHSKAPPTLLINSLKNPISERQNRDSMRTFSFEAKEIVAGLKMNSIQNKGKELSDLKKSFQKKNSHDELFSLVQKQKELQDSTVDTSKKLNRNNRRSSMSDKDLLQGLTKDADSFARLRQGLTTQRKKSDSGDHLLKSPQAKSSDQVGRAQSKIDYLKIAINNKFKVSDKDKIEEVASDCESHSRINSPYAIQLSPYFNASTREKSGISNRETNLLSPRMYEGQNNLGVPFLDVNSASIHSSDMSMDSSLSSNRGLHPSIENYLEEPKRKLSQFSNQSDVSFNPKPKQKKDKHRNLKVQVKRNSKVGNNSVSHNFSHNLSENKKPTSISHVQQSVEEHPNNLNLSKKESFIL